MATVGERGWGALGRGGRGGRVGSKLAPTSSRILCGRELAPDFCISVQTRHEWGMVPGALSSDNFHVPRGRSHAVRRLQSGTCVRTGAAIKCNGEAGKAWIGREANAGVLSAL